ncbi:hypothetical protein C8K66_101357 [Pseudomonas sp. GV105]|nr:hypothetical protein C8K66_101357 [Pseudomonas sp. GV105]CRM61667.1 hypothetical protein [Pseudomonas sp. 25 E 4]
MGKNHKYLKAGTRENTRKSYRAAIEHFEVMWGGYLLTGMALFVAFRLSG